MRGLKKIIPPQFLKGESWAGFLFKYDNTLQLGSLLDVMNKPSQKNISSRPVFRAFENQAIYPLASI